MSAREKLQATAYIADALAGQQAGHMLPWAVREPEQPAYSIPPNRTLAEIEKMAIVQTLQRTNWNKQEAAHILGLYRPTLYSKMKKHNIADGGKAAARRTAATGNT